MAAWLVASPSNGHVPAYFLLNGSSYSLTLSLSRAMSVDGKVFYRRCGKDSFQVHGNDFFLVVSAMLV